MIILNDPTLIEEIPDPHIRHLVVQRYSQLSPTTGCMVEIEPRDTVTELERAIE